MHTTKKICLACQNSFFIQRNPDQQYCPQAACQRFRKNQWRRHQRKQDTDYQENQRKANRHWQQQHPDYWRHYRATHPDYQCRNREQQHQRDHQRRLASAALIPDLAKSDALPKNFPIPSGIYDLIPIMTASLAKSDALRVKITLISACYKG